MCVELETDDAVKAQQDIKEFAYYLGGLNDAWRVTGLPEWIDKEEFIAHVQTSREIQSGGTYRGPFVVLAMAEYVDRLVGQLEKLADQPLPSVPNHG